MSSHPKNGRHSKVTNRWGTEDKVVLAARRLIGDRHHDLDPCTEGCFEQVVGASNNYSLFDRGEDGALLPWFGDVICNPPGGLVRQFWRKALVEVRSGRARSVFWVGFSVEQLCIMADEEDHPLDYATCLLRERVDFTRHDGVRGNPSHSNYVTLVSADADLGAAFDAVFSPLGKVTLGALSGTRFAVGE